MFVISFNICLFIYFSVKYAIQSNDCDVFVNKQSIYLSIYLSIKSRKYYYQVQCQLALSCLERCDIFSYINDSLYHCERVLFDQEFFEKAKDRVDLFYFNFYLT